MSDLTPVYVTETEYLKGRDALHPLTEGMRVNMRKLLLIINRLRHEYGKPFIVTSGYRPAAINKQIKGATNSLHILCAAIDIFDGDPQGAIKRFMMEHGNKRILENGLYMESPMYTPRHIHLQILPPASGNRIFIPARKPWSHIQ